MSSRARYTFLAVLLLAAAVCVRLGFWQLSRLDGRRAYNARILSARQAPTVALNAPDVPRTLAYRQVRVEGRYDPDTDLILRGQMHRQTPGVHVLTPLRPTGGDTAYLVNRGFVPSPDAATVQTETLREPGTVEVTGIALPIESRPDSGRPLSIDGQLTWRWLDLAAIRARLPYPVAPVVILQAPDTALPSTPARLEPPRLGDGPHLSYAVQWFAFATIAVVVGTVVVVRRH